jgi:hypothetical protein
VGFIFQAVQLKAFEVPARHDAEDLSFPDDRHMAVAAVAHQAQRVDSVAVWAIVSGLRVIASPSIARQVACASAPHATGKDPDEMMLLIGYQNRSYATFHIRASVLHISCVSVSGSCSLTMNASVGWS